MGKIQVGTIFYGVAMGCCNLHLNGNQLAPDRLFHIINEHDLIVYSFRNNIWHWPSAPGEFCSNCFYLHFRITSKFVETKDQWTAVAQRKGKQAAWSHSLTFLIIWVTWPLHLHSTSPKHNLLLWMQMISASKDFSSFATNKPHYHEIACQRTFLYKYQYMVPWKLYRNEGHLVYICLQTLK